MSKIKKMDLNTISKILFIIGITIIIIGVFLYNKEINLSKKQEKIKQDKMYYEKLTKEYSLLFENSIPNQKATLSKVSTLNMKANNIKNYEDRITLKSKLSLLKDYIMVNDEINNCYVDGYLEDNVTSEYVDNIEKNYKSLSYYYRNIAATNLEELKKRIKVVEKYKNDVLNCFTDNTYSTVKSDVSRKNYNELVEESYLIMDKNIIKNEEQYLEKINYEITKRETQASIEVERKRIEEINKKKNSWIKLNVPYINQNDNGVRNGCEAACLLMGLKYKNYLKDMDLVTYSKNMPKSNNPFTGFTHDIFSLEPKDVPHWIAPNALVEYGKKSSGNNNIIDATGYSLEQLDQEIVNGNPVVIYLTVKMKKPKEWIENAPKNLHVLLLVGYNTYTNEQLIIDPGQGIDGKNLLTLNKNEVENIYNATGKRAVIIR